MDIDFGVSFWPPFLIPILASILGSGPGALFWSTPPTSDIPVGKWHVATPFLVARSKIARVGLVPKIVAKIGIEI